MCVLQLRDWFFVVEINGIAAVPNQVSQIVESATLFSFHLARLQQPIKDFSRHVLLLEVKKRETRRQFLWALTKSPRKILLKISVPFRFAGHNPTLVEC